MVEAETARISVGVRQEQQSASILICTMSRLDMIQVDLTNVEDYVITLKSTSTLNDTVPHNGQMGRKRSVNLNLNLTINLNKMLHQSLLSIVKKAVVITSILNSASEQSVLRGWLLVGPFQLSLHNYHHSIESMSFHLCWVPPTRPANSRRLCLNTKSPRCGAALLVAIRNFGCWPNCLRVIGVIGFLAQSSVKYFK